MLGQLAWLSQTLFTSAPPQLGQLNLGGHSAITILGQPTTKQQRYATAHLAVLQIGTAPIAKLAQHQLVWEIALNSDELCQRLAILPSNSMRQGDRHLPRQLHRYTWPLASPILSEDLLPLRESVGGGSKDMAREVACLVPFGVGFGWVENAERVNRSTL